ncbi:hypothetical protein X975_00668, partial [Stegodyphus mimosarum]
MSLCYLQVLERLKTVPRLRFVVVIHFQKEKWAKMFEGISINGLMPVWCLRVLERLGFRFQTENWSKRFQNIPVNNWIPVWCCQVLERLGFHFQKQNWPKPFEGIPMN